MLRKSHLELEPMGMSFRGFSRGASRLVCIESIPFWNIGLKWSRGFVQTIV